MDESEPSLTSEIDANIARNIRSNREARGWSQAELAHHLTAAGVPGIHQTTIARIEGGQRPLRAAEAIAICRALEISLEWLSESGKSARLRAESAWLLQKSQQFDEAARELLHAWRLASMQQDEQFPYEADGFADWDAVVRTGVEPRLYEILESRIVEATPHERLSIIYGNALADREIWHRRRGAKHETRVELLADSMREFLTHMDGHGTMMFRDRTADSDDAFQREVLSLFETKSHGVD